MTDLIFLGGFADSGKSSSVEIFRQKIGVPVYSSSELLHSTHADIFKRYKGFSLNTKDKKSKAFAFTVSEGLNKLAEFVSIRDDLIHLAEKILVKNFSRDIFPVGLLRRILEDNPDIAVVETIGGEEYERFIFYADILLPNVKMKNINIRRNSELPGVDIRKLLPDAIDIDNNFSLEDLEFRLKTEYNQICQEFMKTKENLK